MRPAGLGTPAKLAICVVAFAACVLGSRTVVARLRPAEPPPPPSVEDFNYDAALMRFTGQLSRGATREIGRVDGGDTLLALLITSEDVVTCEDLGRQIRDLRRAYGLRRPIAVWTDSTRLDVIRTFLHRERIANTVVGPVPPTAVLADGKRIPSPAALLATRDGKVIEGISHTLRAPNVRLRSFAQEFRTLAAQPGPPGPAAR